MLNLTTETSTTKKEHDGNDESETHDSDLRLIQQFERRRVRLGKRLAYLLRYGAEKEGCKVDEGWVKLNDLMKVAILAEHSKDEVLGDIKTSCSYRKTYRYQWEERPDGIYVRAAYGRKFERNPYHEQSQIRRLLDLTLEYICQNVNIFDFEGFPDEFLINEIIHRIKRQNKLTSKILITLLTDTIEHLDLDGIYLTEAGIRAVYKKCPYLKVLCLKNCGYVLNDHYLEQIIRKCNMLEAIDLSYCRHLTDRTISNIIKYLPNIIQLILSGVKNFSGDAIIQLVSKCLHLKQLDIYDNDNCTNDVLNILITLGKTRSQEKAITIVHKHLQHPSVAPQNPWAVVMSKADGLSRV